MSPEWRCPKGEVSLYSKTITVGADVVDQCTLQAKFWNLSSLFYSGLLRFKKGFYEKVLNAFFPLYLVSSYSTTQLMYEGTAAKRFNIEDTHGIIFFGCHTV